MQDSAFSHRHVCVCGAFWRGLCYLVLRLRRLLLRFALVGCLEVNLQI
ncbi:MAG: hypothetical protein RI918_2249, partial [Pseudomonadota bacterium]